MTKQQPQPIKRMKNPFASSGILIIALYCLTFSCADPTSLGTDLLEQDQANVFVTDTLTLQLSTITEDRVKTYDPDPNLQFDTYLFGDYVDPIMGKTTAGIFTQLSTTSVVPDLMIRAQVDSIVLQLSYDSLAFYGDRSESYGISVFRLTEAMDSGADYYSDAQFDYDPDPLGSINFTPFYGPVSLIDYDSLDNGLGQTYEAPPHLRIPISTTFGEALIADTSALRETTEFLDFLKGFYIKPSTENNNGIMGFNLNAAITGLTVYYTNYDSTSNEDVSRFYTFAPGSSSAKTTFVQTEFSEEVTNAINGSVAAGDTAAYIQGLAGPNIRIDIPYATDLQNVIVNKAELSLTVANPDDMLRRTPVQVLGATRDSEGAYRSIADVALALSRNNLFLFGGQPEESEDGTTVYNFNISTVLQSLIEGETEPIYLRMFSKQERVTRMKVYGPKHSMHPAELTLVYTRLPE